MAKNARSYKVAMARVGVSLVEVEVTANNLPEAIEKAKEQASNIDYSNKIVDYEYIPKSCYNTRLGKYMVLRENE